MVLVSAAAAAAAAEDDGPEGLQLNVNVNKCVINRDDDYVVINFDSSGRYRTKEKGLLSSGQASKYRPPDHHYPTLAVGTYGGGFSLALARA